MGELPPENFHLQCPGHFQLVPVQTMVDMGYTEGDSYYVLGLGVEVGVGEKHAYIGTGEGGGSFVQLSWVAGHLVVHRA